MQSPISKCSHVLRVRASTYKFWGDCSAYNSICAEGGLGNGWIKGGTKISPSYSLTLSCLKFKLFHSSNINWVPTLVFQALTDFAV